MSTVLQNPQDRDALADAAQRRFFPETFRQDALNSGDQDLIAEALDDDTISTPTCEAISFIRAVRSMSLKP